MRWLWLAALTGCGVGIGVEQKAVITGSPASDPSVVAIVGHRTVCGETPPVICTGTLVSERTVLTAAHCVSGGARGIYEVYFGPAVGDPIGHYVGITGTRLHPDYVRYQTDHDLAVVWLSSPAPMAPVPIVDQALDPSIVGKAARVVGFGQDQTGRRQEGAVRVDVLSDHTLRYGPAPSMTCTGDSGGPVFVAGVLAGVTSEGDLLCASYGLAARVDQAIFWGELTGVPPSLATSIGETAVCRSDCITDADCPSDLQCAPLRSGRQQCVVPAQESGQLGAACSGNDPCGGGTCVPVGDACRCLVPCAAAGCNMTTMPATENAMLLLALVAYLIAASQRRSRAGRPSR